MGAADGAVRAADADGRRCRPDHQVELVRSLQIPAQPDRVLARQCRRADRRLRHHALGALAVRAVAESLAAGSGQDDDPAQCVWLRRPPLLFVLLGVDGTAQRRRPAGPRRRHPDHRGRLQLRRRAVRRVGVLAAAGLGLLLRRWRLRHCRALCGGGLAVAPADHGHGFGLWLRGYRQDHRAGRPRLDRGLRQLPEAGRAAAADSSRLRLSRLLVTDGRRGVLCPRHRDQGQVDRADRQGTSRRGRTGRDDSRGSTSVELDPMIATSADLAGDQSLISRAEAVRPAVDAASNEIESTRRLPPALLDKLHEAQLFRLLLPRSSDGIETDPMTFFHVIETIARADASTAWCLSQAGGCAMSAAYLDLPVAHAIFGNDPRAVLAWGPGPKVKAVECEGGYKVTGVWAFASGGRHATWLGAHCPIYAADGSPKRDVNGEQQERTMLVRTEDAQWTDIWNTVGLRGTASDQFALDDFFVRSDHSITREFDRECRESGPLYRMGSGTCYQVGFAGVACGIARGALDSFLDVARNKVPRGAKSPLRDNAVVQSNLAQAEVNLRAARGYVLQSMADTWRALTAGATITVAQRINIRMAATHAIHKAREAVDFAYNAAGATAIFENHPLERRFRDIHTVTQQLQGQLRHFETVGAWMMGADADLTFV